MPAILDLLGGKMTEQAVVRKGGTVGLNRLDPKNKLKSIKKERSHYLVVTSNRLFAENFSIMAKKRGLTVFYAWSLESLDWLPLHSVATAIVTDEVWTGEESQLRGMTKRVLDQIPKVMIASERLSVDQLDEEFNEQIFIPSTRDSQPLQLKQ